MVVLLTGSEIAFITTLFHYRICFCQNRDSLGSAGVWTFNTVTLERPPSTGNTPVKKLCSMFQQGFLTLKAIVSRYALTIINIDKSS